jgi:hypothetical protein
MCKMNVNLIYLFFCEKYAEKVKSDLFEIEPKVPYTKPDLDWMNKKSRRSYYRRQTAKLWNETGNQRMGKLFINNSVMEVYRI